MIVLNKAGPDGTGSAGCPDVVQQLIYIGISVLMVLSKTGNDCLLKMDCISN